VKDINVKTLVQHGANDPLLPPDHGRHTAELIEGSKLVIYEGMGHNLPPKSFLQSYLICWIFLEKPKRKAEFVNKDHLKI
jgi:predicted esterase